ncbi:hypothetical protein [Photobacterium nomapromontoriensis]|uniref:hypothetical protein n=1 Tax=Photobacterium nomapromontoriensis TaxID=2910237 RepID=UPI003D13BE63
MEKLKLAKALFTQPLTLDELRKLEQLEQQAQGEERQYITALWSTAYDKVNPVVLRQARVAGLL